MTNYIELILINKRFDTLSRIIFNIDDYNNTRDCKKIAYNKFNELRKQSKDYIYCWINQGNKRMFLKSTTVKTRKRLDHFKRFGFIEM